MISNPSLPEQILSGIRSAENKYWRFSKDLIKIKPEYLLAVAVAEKIADSGFERFSGLDLSIKLEERTSQVLFESTFRKFDFKEYWKIAKSWRGRTGKVDIFIKSELEPRCYVVELKGVDPSASEIKKELQRFNRFFNASGVWENLKSCHLAFPTTSERSAWLRKLAQAIVDDGLAVACLGQHFATGESPEDGIPAYYANVLTVQLDNCRAPTDWAPAE